MKKKNIQSFIDTNATVLIAWYLYQQQC